MSRVITKRVKWLSAVFLLLVVELRAQEPLAIDSCYALARRNYPQIKQFDLITKTSEFNISNASKAYLPQVSVTGIGAYVFGGLPEFSIPGFPTAEDSKVKFIGIAQVNQNIWDGGATKTQKEIVKANEGVEKSAVEVSLYNLKDRINQLYFGILLIDVQTQQLDVQTDRYNINLNKATLSKANGLAYQSDIDEIKAEILNIEQRKIEFKYTRKGYVEMLSYLIGLKLDEQVQLEKPAVLSSDQVLQNNRPELSFYLNQRKLAEAQVKQVKVGNMPKIGLLGAGVLIAPPANLGIASLSSLALAGVSVNWNVGNLYRSSNNRELNKLQIAKIQTEEETFMFNNSMQVKHASADIEKYQAILRKDEEIIAIKGTIKNSYQLKYDNGISPMSDLITAMNKESEAKSNQAYHQMQLLMALYNRKTINGN